MQIDFHHGATYIIARLAGFGRQEADVIAHSAQYVDDATASGEIYFDNGGLYERTASAHKLFDYRNTRALANHRVWLPFHFLPGNKGEPQPDSPPLLEREAVIERSICRPNSHPARQMMRAVVERQDRPYALHRVGIAAHVFVDTWAHQGFVGFNHVVNLATDVVAENDEHHAKTFREKFADFFHHALEEVEERFVGDALPLGHGVVLSYPDRPYLVWSYRNGRGELIHRDNPKEFAEAAYQLFQWFSRYRAFHEHGPDVFEKTFKPPREFTEVTRLIKTNRSENMHERHSAWIASAGDGRFGFRDELSYIEKGPGSWKEIALGTIEDLTSNEGSPIPCPPTFHTSNWKRFHDALQAHRFFVLHEMLPAYGILST
jgi:hypothetical protein